MEKETNQTYTIDEKTGMIIKVEEANEKQKQQKLMFRVKIAALCTAIGLGGAVGMSSKISENSHHQSVTVDFTDANNQIEEQQDQFQFDDNQTEKEQQKQLTPNDAQFENYMKITAEKGSQYCNVVISFFSKNGDVIGFPDELVEPFFELGQDNFELAKQTGLSRKLFGYTNKVTENQFSLNSMNETKESETKDAVSYKTIAYLEENLVNGEWISGNVLFRNASDIPLDTNDKRYIFCGASEENKDNLYVYQKEIRKVSTDLDGTYRIESDWTPVMEFNVTTNTLEIPHDTLDSRYVIIGCGDNIARMMEESNSQNQVGDTVSTERTR